MLHRPPSEWVKRQDRKPASTTGVAYRADGDWVRAHMTNLAYDGCHLLTENQLDVGETVTLVMPGMQHLKAQVRWVGDNRAGLRFLHNATAADERRARLGF